MTLTALAVRNLARNKFRVLLTVCAVSIAIVAFLLLRTVTWAWASGAEWAAKDRVVTRHKVTFVMTLPKRYVDQVRLAPHIKTVTWANWFGGKDPKHDREFFSTLAVDPATYFAVYDEMRVPPDQMDAFVHDRQGAIVGDVLAKKLGWKPGDKVMLQSGIFPGDWQFTIDGIYTATAKSMDRSTMVFHWDYLNDSLPPARRDEVGWIISRVDDPAHVADIGVGLDRAFEERDTPTLSQDERSFNASFLAMFSAILKGMDIVSGVILVIMTLILGNTIAMGARERMGEYGVLRAIGFLPSHVALWIVAESLATALLGGLLGLALAWPFINLGVGRFIEENMGSFFPYFRLEAGNAVLAVAVAALLGAAAGAVPAWRASKLRVIDAIRRVA
ncbi:MAG: FtsX-like permease family protein [Myxococcota bacterium]|nr:FtsX-like permease family protein [Myxococcota bacterium]